MAEPTEPRDEIINDLCLRNDTLRRERDEAVRLLLDALYQACGEFDTSVQGYYGNEGGNQEWQGQIFLGFNNGAISTWEGIEEFLHERGEIGTWTLTETRYLAKRKEG